MGDKGLRIAVAGDVSIDWFKYSVRPKDQGLNWELYPGMSMFAKPGGALLQADFIIRAVKVTGKSPKHYNI